MKTVLKCFLSTIIALVTTSVLYGQKADWIRHSVSNDPYAETLATRVAVHPDGNIFVLGQFYGIHTVSGLPLNSPVEDGFLAKYNPQGEIIWLKEIFDAAEGYNHLIDLKVDQNGNLVFSGSCLWPSSILGSEIGVGPFIAKIDKDGNLLWLNFQPTPGSVAENDVSRRGNRIGFDTDNNIFWLTDQINESVPNGALTVMKYNSDGVILAAIPTVNPRVYERPRIEDFSVSADGSFVVSGNFSGPITITGGPQLSNNSSPQFFLAKFTAAGNFESVVYSNSGQNYLTAHSIDSQGNLYAAFQTNGGKLSTPQGEVDLTSGSKLLRIRPDGRIDWINELPSTSVESIMMGSDGFVYMAGIRNGSEFRYQSYTQPIEGEAAFVLKINAEGFFNGVYIGQSSDEILTSLGPYVDVRQSVIDGAGNIYTIGNFRGKQAWSCLSATVMHFSFYLTKHVAIQSPIQLIITPPVICDGYEISLSTDLVSSDFLYKWFTPDGQEPSTGAPLENSISYTVYATNNGKPVIVSINDACDSYFAKPFVLNVSVPPAPEVTPDITNYCSATEFSITLQAMGTNLTWYHDAELSDVLSTNESPEIVPTDGTTYYVTQKISGCEGNATAFSITDIRPQPPETELSVEYCTPRNGQILLNASGEGTINWYDNSSLSSVLSTGTSIMVTPDDQKTIFVTQTVSSCESLPAEIVTNLAEDCIFTGVESEWARSLSIFPNPAGEVFTIKHQSHDINSVEVLNALGQTEITVKNPNFHNGYYEMRIHLLPGIYIIRMQKNREVAIRQLVIK